jgi:hypothetical protein
MTLREWTRRLAAAARRWHEDRVTCAALARLDPRDRAEFETLMGLRRDAEFDSKARSVRDATPSHIASPARRAHS